MILSDQNNQSGLLWLETRIREERNNRANLPQLIAYPYDDLNIMQKNAFNLVESYLLRNEQCLLIFRGSAGVGKTAVIAGLSTLVQENEIIRAAFTGTASHLIKGRTIHSTFMLDVEKGSKQFSILAGQRLTDFQDTFHNTRLILIDEYSMVSSEMLEKIES